MALPLQTLEFGAQIGAGTAIFASAIVATRGALRLAAGTVGMALRDALSLPALLSASDEIDDGPGQLRAVRVVYCGNDGRSKLAITRPLESDPRRSNRIKL